MYILYIVSVSDPVWANSKNILLLMFEELSACMCFLQYVAILVAIFLQQCRPSQVWVPFMARTKVVIHVCDCMWRRCVEGVYKNMYVYIYIYANSNYINTSIYVNTLYAYIYMSVNKTKDRLSSEACSPVRVPSSDRPASRKSCFSLEGETEPSDDLIRCVSRRPTTPRSQHYTIRHGKMNWCILPC